MAAPQDTGPPAGQGSSASPVRRRRRALRLLALLPVLFLLVLAVALLALSLAPVRRSLLLEALRRADGALPGRLLADGPSWPEPGRLRFDGLLWTDGADTLLAAGPLEIAVDLFALAGRRLELRSLTLDGLRLDLPALRARFPEPAAGEPERTKGNGFLRPGALPGMPSVSCADLRIAAGPLRLDTLRTVEELRLGGGFDVVGGRVPWLRLEELLLRLPQAGLVASSRDLLLEPAAGRLSGALQAVLGPERSFDLRIAAPGSDRYRLSADVSWDGAPLSVELEGAVIRDEGRATGLSAAGDLRLPSGDALRGAGVALPAGVDPPALGLRVEGELAFGPRAPSRLALSIAPNDWALAGGLTVRREDGTLSIDGLRLALDGLLAEGDLRRTGSDLSARLRLDAVSADWFARFGLQPLERLQASATLSVDGPADGPALSLDLSAAATTGGTTLDTLRLRSRRRAGSDRPLRASLLAESSGLRLLATFDLRQGADWSATFDTLRLVETDGPSPAESGGGRATRFADGSLRIDDLELAGDGLLLRADAQRRPDGSGTAGVRLDLPRIPRALLARLALDDSLRARLAAGWARGDEPGLQADLVFGPGGAPLDATVSALLPGPPRLSGLLPPGARLEGLGDLLVDGRFASAEGRFDVRATGAGWLDSLRSTGRVDGSGWRLDTLAAALPGLVLSASGSGTGGELDLVAGLDASSTTLATRFAPALADWNPSLRLDVVASGPASAPTLEATLAGAVASPPLSADSVAGALRLDPGSLSASLRLAGLLQVGGQPFDSLALAWQGPAGESGVLPGRIELRAAAPGWSSEQTVALARDSGWRLDWSRFLLRVSDLELAAASPFTFRLEEDGGLVLERLDLAGSLGRLEAAFRLNGAAPALHAHGEITALAPLLAGRVPEVLQPARLRFAFDADGDTLRRGDLLLAGLPLRPKQPVDLSLALSGLLAAPRFTVAATGAADTLLAGSGALPGALSLSPLSFASRSERLAFDLHATGLPLPLDALLPSVFEKGERARLAGRLAFRGGLEEPAFDGELRLDFSESRRLRDWSLRLEADLAGSALETPALQAHVELLRGGRSVIHGGGRLPLARDSLGLWRAGDLTARLDAEDLELVRLNDWLPADLWLEGRGTLGLSVTGPLANPRLDGRARVPSVKVGQATGTRLFASTDLRLSGRLTAPAVEGWLSLDNGVVAIPDIPRRLHPVEGEARLWTLRPVVEAPVHPQRKAGLLDSLALDVDLRVPRPIRFEGRDLKLDASGDLRLVSQEGFPRVTGQLEATGGSFRLLSRTIDVQRGQVTFYGEDVLDPTLDLELGAAIDGSAILVTLSGTFIRPRLEFASDPPMDEGEIVALLLFGRPSNELDVDQQELLQRRATQMAADYGMARLNARLARDLGVDLLRYQANGVGGRSSLEVGKYIGPRVFVRYEQALDQQNLFRLQLDYILTRRLRLESSYGRQSQSGLQLNWIKRY